MELARVGQYLSFSLTDLSYAIPISAVREINRVLTITPIPETPKYIAGVMNLRGKVIPIVDLRVRFGMPSGAHTKHTCIIVVDSDQGLAGLLVDSIQGVVALKADQIEPRPQLQDQASLTFVVGMGKVDKNVLVLVDVSRVLLNAGFESLTNAA